MGSDLAKMQKDSCSPQCPSLPQLHRWLGQQCPSHRLLTWGKILPPVTSQVGSAHPQVTPPSCRPPRSSTAFLHQGISFHHPQQDRAYPLPEADLQLSHANYKRCLPNVYSWFPEWLWGATTPIFRLAKSYREAVWSQGVTYHHDERCTNC